MCTSTSMADPAAGVLPPVRWRGRLLADGGIADNTPVSHAVALGARRIYVLLTQNPGDLVRYALAM